MPKPKKKSPFEKAREKAREAAAGTFGMGVEASAGAMGKITKILTEKSKKLKGKK